MSRLDQKNGKPKGTPMEGNTTAFSSSPEELVGRIKTADSYSDRARRGKQAVDSLKGRGLPLGGAPPIAPGKLESLTQPVFGTGVDEPDSREIPRRPVEPPAPPPGIGGVGAGYAVNQAMARGELNRPISLREARQAAVGSQTKARNPMSDETIEALQKVKENAESNTESSLNSQSQEHEEETKAPNMSDEDKDRLEKVDEDLVGSDPPIDFDGLSVFRNRLSSPERKKSIESRLKPLNIGDMIIKKELRQKVPVKPKQLEFELRTFNQHEHLFCLKYVYNNPGAALYMEELLNTAKMVCSVVAINGIMLPEHRIHIGRREEAVDQTSFEEKLFHIASFPVQLIADMSLQVIWFGQRVNNLLDVDDLKNG